MEVLMLKIILVFVMMALTIAFGLFPVKLLRILRKRANRRSSGVSSIFDERSGSRWPALLLSMLSCFTGGVFLATCFLHLLPEVITHFDGIREKYHLDSHYPFPELISCLGFFLVFFVEELTLFVLKRLGHDVGHNHGAPTHVHVPHSSSPSEFTQQVALSSTPGGHVHKRNGFVDHFRSKSPRHTDHDAQLAPSELLKFRPRRISSNSIEAENSRSPMIAPSFDDDYKVLVKHPSTNPGNTNVDNCGATKNSFGGSGNNIGMLHNRKFLLDKGTSGDDSSDLGDPSLLCSDNGNPGGAGGAPSCGGDCHTSMELIPQSGTAEPECCDPCDTHDDPCADPPIKINRKPHEHSHGVRSATLLIALSFHSVIEGMAFGIMSSNESALALFLSLIFHKVIVAFSVGLQLARTHNHQLKWVVFSIVGLAVMSPIGAFFGIGVNEMNSDLKELLVMVFEGLSVGTFLYVTFFEVFIHERDNDHNAMLKLLASAVGFGVIALIRIMEHSHEQMHNHVEGMHGAHAHEYDNATLVGGGDGGGTPGHGTGHSHEHR